MANIVPYAERLHLASDDVVLMASPMAHQTGFMYGLMMPIMLRASAVLQDIWEPRKAIELIRAEGASFTMASTPFLTDLAKTVAETGPACRRCAPSCAPARRFRGRWSSRRAQALGTKIVSAWGMTENGAVTLIKLGRRRRTRVHDRRLPAARRRGARSSMSTAAPCRRITSGKLMVRACSNFGGYLNRPQLEQHRCEGWFDTGDLARIDERGYIRITGRSKDVIIRGGENIPVVEIEALLYRHPRVAQAAIVAYPGRTPGRARLRGGRRQARPASIDLPGMVDFLKAQKVALQYIPERLDRARRDAGTPSGKIQKFKLRELVAEAAK